MNLTYKIMNLITGYRIKPVMSLHEKCVHYPNASRVNTVAVSIGNNREEITYDHYLTESI